MLGLGENGGKLQDLVSYCAKCYFMYISGMYEYKFEWIREDYESGIKANDIS